MNREGQVCPASLRLEGISPELMALLAAGGQRTVTLAPETGSERLRRVINKRLLEDQILEKTAIAMESGISHLKLYFMLGLPTEEQEDVEAIVELTKQIHHVIQKSCHSRQLPWDIQLSISPFVPKPFTPFQWEAMEEVEILNTKLKQIKKALSKVRQVRVFHNVPKWSYIQALLSRGDRRVGDLLTVVHYLKGNWRKAFREVNLNPDYYVYRQREQDERFPWDHIDMGISKESLKQMRKKALGKNNFSSIWPGCR